MTYYPTTKDLRTPREKRRDSPPPLNTPRHARAVQDDPNDPLFHMAMCGAGYPWPSPIALEPRRDTPQNLQFWFVTQVVTCRQCVTAIEQRRQPANPIPNHSSDN